MVDKVITVFVLVVCGILGICLVVNMERVKNHDNWHKRQMEDPVKTAPGLQQQRHSKTELNGHTYLSCGDIIIAMSPAKFENVNFSVSECQICGMFVQTTGHSKESTQIREVHNQIGQNMSDLNKGRNHE